MHIEVTGRVQRKFTFKNDSAVYTTAENCTPTSKSAIYACLFHCEHAPNNSCRNSSRRNIVIITPPLIRSAEHCDEIVCLAVCVRVCLCVCVSVSDHISGTIRPIFTKFSVLIA